MIRLVLVRHGQSVWNLENRFTGWTDVPLSLNGINEAKEAGLLLKKNNYKFDLAFTSVLKRASDTLDIILNEMGQDVEVIQSYKLNERHYGALQGLNKDKAKEEYGESMVKLWRRSADVRPPALSLDDPRYPGNDPKYEGIDNLPVTENLIDTEKRVVSYFDLSVAPLLKAGKQIIIVAHGNSLRGLIKHLNNLSNDEIMDVEIPTGSPLCFEFDEDLNVLNSYYIRA